MRTDEIDYVFPAETDRADNDQLDEACTALEDALNIIDQQEKDLKNAEAALLHAQREAAELRDQLGALRGGYE